MSIKLTPIITFLKRIFREPGTRRFGLSFFFGSLVILVYYLLLFIIPLELELHNEIVTILFVLISVILLFPAREFFLHKILSKYDYLSYFGHDPHHMELLAQHFSIDELKNKLFLEFMEWLDTSSAMMAILDPGRDHYNYFMYSRGNQVQEIKITDKTYLSEAFLRYLKLQKNTVDSLYENLSEQFRSEMLELKAVTIHPFIYRKNLTGYLVFYDQPKHPHANRALDFFSRMAAVAIQNYILSMRVIDSQEYDLELQSAKRIQKIFSTTNVPSIKGFDIQPRGSTKTVIEFFKTKSGSFFLIALSVGRLTGASGIILYGLLGNLHALLHREPETTINKLLNYLRNDPEFSKYEYNIEILITEITANEPQITILNEGGNYSFCNVRQVDKNLLSLGWRNLIELDRDNVYLLSYMSVPLLSIEHTKNKIVVKSNNKDKKP